MSIPLRCCERGGDTLSLMHIEPGMRATVMGLGRFGGGVGVTRWLAGQGVGVLVTDLAPAGDLAGPIEQIRDLVDAGVVTLRLGGHAEDDFVRTDLVVANPAVPRPATNPMLEAARGARVPITTEIALVLERLPDPRRLIAITGSAGKSTTAALCAHILGRCDQPAVLCGNIGGSLLGALGTLTQRTWVVAELSSAMLWWLGAVSPAAAVVTSFAPNHLDWHESLDEYRRCKRRLLEYQQPGSVAVLPRALADWAAAPGVDRVLIDERDAIGGLAIPGAHNGLNAALAVAAAGRASGVDRTRLAEAARSFAGLPHRLELIDPDASIRCYNDSKSTTPAATALALEAFAPATARVHLIVGGYDKDVDQTPIARLAPRVAGLYAIGATGPRIVAQADHPRAQLAVSLDEAMDAIARVVRPGDVVLLSPGCASWDQFPNYEARGARFAALVERMIP